MNIIELAKEAGFVEPTPRSLKNFERFAALVRAEALAEHKCGGCAKTAADGWALYCVECWEKAEPVKQEPVAKIVLNRANQITMQNPDGGYFDVSKYVGATFYAVPVDAKAIRAEALEEAAKVCDELGNLNRKECTDSVWQWAECAAAIRGLK